MEISAEELAKKWAFPWLTMEVMIGGKSSIDLSEIALEDYDEARKFIECYGYDTTNPKDQRLLGAILIEATNFIMQYLVTDSSLYPPEEILLCDDVCKLLEYASSKNKANAVIRPWACAVLRVAHTIAHIKGAQQFVNYKEAGRQIRERFDRHFQTDSNGQLWLGEIGKGVELEKVEWKMEKSRQSIILKLLHKAGNVAETIFDLIGVRIVTKNLADVLLVLHYLRQDFIISVPNCHPSRSRNNLIDVNRFRSNLEMMIDMVKSKRLDPAEFPNLLEKLTQGGDVSTFSLNPHSGANYKAIQMTCRQLIRYTEHASCPGEEISAFFPFEVQVLDKDAYQANQYGEASHDRYKLAQVRTARRRVMGEVLSYKK